MSSLPCVRALMLSCGLPRLEARMLLQHLLQRPTAWLLAHDTDPIDAKVAADFDQLAQRRLAGEPMAYLVGHREFMGHRFGVRPGVLIPRPDTELLVETAAAFVQSHVVCGHECRVLDMGCGSGAIAISLALVEGIRAQITALDISEAALAVARENAAALGAQVRFVHSDWFAALAPGEAFDLIVSNPPYIAADDPHLTQGDLRYEPSGALTDGADGLTDIRLLVGAARKRLNPGGAIWLEHGWTQAAAVRELLQEAGFNRVSSLNDLAGIERISGGYL